MTNGIAAARKSWVLLFGVLLLAFGLAGTAVAGETRQHRRIWRRRPDQFRRCSIPSIPFLGSGSAMAAAGTRAGALPSRLHASGAMRDDRAATMLAIGKAGIARMMRRPPRLCEHDYNLGWWRCANECRNGDWWCDHDCPLEGLALRARLLYPRTLRPRSRLPRTALPRLCDRECRFEGEHCFAVCYGRLSRNIRTRCSTRMTNSAATTSSSTGISNM